MDDKPTMGQVIGLDRKPVREIKPQAQLTPDQTGVVDLLTDLLNDAKAGRFTSMGYAAVTSDGRIYMGTCYPQHEWPKLGWATHCLLNDLQHNGIDTDDD